MSRHLFILTGASRGMGLAIASKLLKPGNTLLCISRKTSDALTREASASGATLLPLRLRPGEPGSAAPA